MKAKKRKLNLGIHQQENFYYFLECLAEQIGLSPDDLPSSEKRQTPDGLHKLMILASTQAEIIGIDREIYESDLKRAQIEIAYLEDQRDQTKNQLTKYRRQLLIANEKIRRYKKDR